MNQDFKDLLRIFNEERVEYLIVGGYALIKHSEPRYTKDLDLWVSPSKENWEESRIWPTLRNCESRKFVRRAIR